MESDEKSFQSIDNSSFVIIKKISAENQKQIELTDNLLKNSALNVIIEKFNTETALKNQPIAEEIERTVSELLRENAKLKETLQQNNASMKNQLTTFSKLHDEVSKIHQSHKQKFEEMKELVLKLRAENQEQKNREWLWLMRKAAFKNVKNNEVPNENVQLTQEKSNAPQQKLCNDQNCASFKSEIVTENRLLKQKLKSIQYELLQHLTANSRSDKEQELHQVIGDLTKQLENAERCRRKLTLDLDRLTAQEAKLQRILSSGDSRNVTDCCYWNALFPTAVISTPFEVQLVENLKRYDELLNTSENIVHELPEMKLQLSSDSSWVNLNTSNDEQTLQLIKSDVALCYKLLSQEQAINASRKELLDNARSRFKEIYKQCLTILKEHDSKMKAREIECVKTKEKLKEVENLRHELSDKQNRITHLESELGFLENVLEKNSQEIERRNEDLSLLRSQIKVYEEDFVSERQARESLSNEKDHLEHRLNCLQLRNEELLKELKRSPDDNSEKSMKETIEKTLPQNEYECFNETCNESFASEEELQQHVYSCLNIKD